MEKCSRTEVAVLKGLRVMSCNGGCNLARLYHLSRLLVANLFFPKLTPALTAFFKGEYRKKSRYAHVGKGRNE